MNVFPKKIFPKGKIFFTIYKIDSLIGEGSFGTCYKGLNILNNEEVCLKLESKDSPKQFLENESIILEQLKGGKGIPEFFLYGFSDNNNILIMELLNETLHDIFIRCHYKFSTFSICLLTIQIVSYNKIKINVILFYS